MEVNSCRREKGVCGGLYLQRGGGWREEWFMVSSVHSHSLFWSSCKFIWLKWCLKLMFTGTLPGTESSSVLLLQFTHKTHDVMILVESWFKSSSDFEFCFWPPVEISGSLAASCSTGLTNCVCLSFLFSENGENRRGPDTKRWIEDSYYPVNKRDTAESASW